MAQPRWSRRGLAPLLLSLWFPLAATAAETALDRYVKTPDPAYKFEVVSTISGNGYTAQVIDLTSQSWLTPGEVNRTVWKHWLTVIKPDRLAHATGFLSIGGGSNRDAAPARVDPFLAQLAVLTQSVTADLRMVPNQPLSFDGETNPRFEDSLIAYAWARYLKGAGDQWLPRLPMTKAAVRAMDTVTAVVPSVTRFAVMGGSKRGWTTWTTAATDSRVVALIPAVIDMLNVVPSFNHHWRVYGAWAPAIKDYLDNDIMRWSGTPRYRELMKIVEPYEYRDRLTQPKYIVNAAGDEFFLPDSSQFYWNDLKGEKLLRYVPNAKHSLAGSDGRDTVSAFYSMLLNGKPRPRYSFRFEKDGAIRLETKDRPETATLWQATNPETRDFRLDTIGKAYQPSPLTESKPGVYSAKVPKPAKGWTAFFIELSYPSGTKYPLKVTSGVRVWPDVYPFEAPNLGTAAGPGATSTPPAVRTSDKLKP